MKNVHITTSLFSVSSWKWPTTLPAHCQLLSEISGFCILLSTSLETALLLAITTATFSNLTSTKTGAFVLSTLRGPPVGVCVHQSRVWFDTHFPICCCCMFKCRQDNHLLGWGWDSPKFESGQFILHSRPHTHLAESFWARNSPLPKFQLRPPLRAHTKFWVSVNSDQAGSCTELTPLASLRFERRPGSSQSRGQLGGAFLHLIFFRLESTSTRRIPKLFPADVAYFCCSVKIFTLPLVSNGIEWLWNNRSQSDCRVAENMTRKEFWYQPRNGWPFGCHAGSTWCRRRVLRQQQLHSVFEEEMSFSWEWQTTHSDASMQVLVGILHCWITRQGLSSTNWSTNFQHC